MTRCERSCRQGVFLGLFLVACLPVFAQQNTQPEAKPLTQAERGMLSEATELMQQKKFEAAEVQLKKIVALSPGLMVARQMYAAVLISQNRYAEAIAMLDQMLVENPSDHRVLNNLSWLLATATDPRFRDPPRALQLAQDAVLLAPGDYHVWSTLAEAHQSNANFDQAVKAMQQALELSTRLGASEDERRNYIQQLLAMQEKAAIMSLMEQ